MQDLADDESVGRRVRALREAHNDTQQTLATRAGIAIRTLAALEGGQTVSLETLRRVATALDIRVTDLIDPAA